MGTEQNFGIEVSSQPKITSFAAWRNQADRISLNYYIIFPDNVADVCLHKVMYI